MKKSKKMANQVLFLLIVMLLSCAENDKPEQKNLPKFENTETLTVWDEDVVKLNTTVAIDTEIYDLFVGDSKQEYTTESSSLIFKAKYRTENENKELSVFLKDKQGKTIATGGKIKVIRTYRYYRTTIGIGSPFLSTFIINNDNNFNLINPVGTIGNEIIIRQYNFSGINDDIWSKDTGNSSLSPIVTQFDEPATGLGNNVVPQSRNDRFYSLGFAKYGNKFYFPKLYRSTTGTIVCPILVFDGVSASTYKHNNQPIYFPTLLTDIVIDSHGNLFVYCLNNPAIYKLSETNGIQLFAGSETESGYQDAKGRDARFGTPLGDGIRNLLIDSNDNLYVAEKTKIRKIAPDGTVSTVIGTNESADVVGSMTEARFTDIKSFAMTKKNVIYLTEEATDYIKIIDTNKQNVTKMKVVVMPGYTGDFNTSGHYRMIVNEQGTIFMERALTANSSAITILCPTDLQKKN